MAVDTTTDFTGFPNPLAPQEEKAKQEYGMRYAKAIWARQQLYLSTYSEQKNRFMLNRKYAEGLQSVQKYKDAFGTGDTSWLNLDFSIISVIPKFVNNIVGLLTSNKYKIDVETLNSTSKVSQDEFRNKLYANKLLKPLHDQIAPKTGLPLVPDNAQVPEDDEELEIYAQQSFKPSDALAMQVALKSVFEYNKFDEVAEQVIRDLVNLKIAGIRRYYDKNQNICLEYVDIVDVQYPYSKYEDFRNIPWIAVDKKYTIQEIAILAPELTEEDLFQIAQQYQGNNYGNRNWNYGMSYAGYYPSIGVISGRAYDDFNISVLEFEFLGTDSVKYEKKTSKDKGNSYFNRKSSDYQPKPDKKYDKEVVDKTIKNRYEGSWIVGSKYLYGYKKANNIPREKINGVYSTEASLSIKIIAPQVYDMQNKSLTESMIPFADQMQLIKLKIQQLLMKMLPAGYGVDMDAVMNVMNGLGGATMKPADVIKMFTQTGSIIFKRTREDGREINGDPIKFLPGGLPVGFELLVQAYDSEMKGIYSVIGYNPAAAGEASDESLVGVGEQNVAATNNSLAPLRNAFLKLVNMVIRETGLMVQDKLENGSSIEGFERAIGKETIEVIKAAKGIPMCEFGISAKYLPDAKEQASLTQKLNIALQEQTLDVADSIQVEQQAKTDIKLATQLLVYLKKKRQKVKMQEAQQNSQMNAQQQQGSVQAKMQADQATIQAESQAKIQHTTVEMDLKDRNAEREHQRRMEELLVTADHNTDAEKLTHDLSLLEKSFDNATQVKPAQ